jgi:hypothetical protein
MYSQSENFKALMQSCNALVLASLSKVNYVMDE